MSVYSRALMNRHWAEDATVLRALLKDAAVTIGRLDDALSGLVSRDASYHGEIIHIEAENHSDAIRRMRVAREALNLLNKEPLT